MATKVHMEALSPTMEEGQVVKWHKAEGDEVSQGEVLAEIETDKATMELVARGDGTLRKILKGEGETAPVGEVIAVIAAPDEDISSLASTGGKGAAKGGKSKSDNESQTQRDEEADGNEGGASGEEASEGQEAGAEPDTAPEEGAPPKGEASSDEGGGKAMAAAPQAAEDREGGRLRASPLARRLAEEAGLELETIAGSGPGGRVVKRDVEEAAHRGEVGGTAAQDGPEYEDVKLSQMRKTIARRLSQSIGPVPHFFLTIDVDMDRAIQARARINDLLEPRGEKISLNDLLIRATAAALHLHPEVNAHWGGDHIRRWKRVHVGVAVAIEDGLITPVIRDADAKGVAAIAREIRDLAGKARDKKLKPEEYTGATFSISNLGMFGIHEFTAVINPPEAGILAVGQVEEVPVVMDGQVVVRPRMRITMSCDHRVIDGAMGARFLQTLKSMLEEPGAILA